MGLSFTACSTDSNVTYDPIVYTSMAANGDTYKLTITKNTGKAAFTPANGDNYTLTITYVNGTTKTSTGTVASYSSTVITFAGATGATFTITINSSGTVTKIEGTITLNDNTTVAAPGAVTPQPGDTTPAANPFANTTWKYESWNDVCIFRFGTDTFTYEEIYNGNSERISGSYTVSGNTATLYFGSSSETVTIRGNNLILITFIGDSSNGLHPEQITFTRVN